MAAPTYYYVDPGSGSDISGDGLSDGTAWASLQHALDNITRDATNGDQINLKAGTADVLSAVLDASTYGSTASNVPLIIRGYLSTANDGGVGEVDCNGNAFCSWTGGIQPNRECQLVDLEIRNGGVTGTMVSLGINCSVQNCEIHDANAGLLIGQESTVINSAFYDLADFGVSGSSTSLAVMGCWFADGTKSFGGSSGAIETANAYLVCIDNIFSLTGSGTAILVGNFDDPIWICNNSIFCAGGSGTGIEVPVSSGNGAVIMNNLIEGFSASGGVGLDLGPLTEPAHRVSNNAVYNCTTEYSVGDEGVVTDDNESLSASPFSKSGSNTFANRFTYFEPADTGNVLTGFPSGSNKAKGAVQPASGGGGNQTIDPFGIGVALS